MSRGHEGWRRLLMYWCGHQKDGHQQSFDYNNIATKCGKFRPKKDILTKVIIEKWKQSPMNIHLWWPFTVFHIILMWFHQNHTISLRFHTGFMSFLCISIETTLE